MGFDFRNILVLLLILGFRSKSLKIHGTRAVEPRSEKKITRRVHNLLTLPYWVRQIEEKVQ